MTRHFYYLESDDIDGLFEYLDENRDEGLIDYKNDEFENIVSINLLELSEEHIFDKLVNKYDCIEDMDYEDGLDEDFDDFYDDNFEE
jgi:hypothetical protein